MIMDNTDLKTGKQKVIAGISKATAMIKETYGAAGGNIIIEESLYPFHTITNDGKKIVDSIHLADRYENVGANIIKEAGDKADKDSGDGRKTTMLLTEAIFKESESYTGLLMDLNRSLNDCIPILHKAINDQKKDITVDDVGAVATISSENEEIGKMVQEIYQKIGKEGIIEVDNSNLPETFYEVTEGVRLRGARYLGEYSTTEPGKAVYKNPKILISKDKITSVDQLDPLFGSLKRQNVFELVIYCDDIDMSVASRLALTHLQGGFKTLLIKAPTLWKDWLFEDFAKITGATPVDLKEGKTFKNLTLEDLGTCETIITDDEETRVIGIKDITNHLNYLEEQGSDDARLRKAWLQTKVAILKVGANSESELSYRSKKARDACNASFLALEDGVVAGGGVALLNAADSLPDTVGGNILKKVLEYPIIQICNNAEVEWSGASGVGIGYDVKNGCMVDMVEAQIIDPALVVKNAIKNAISIASTVLTSKGSIIIPYESIK